MQFLFEDQVLDVTRRELRRARQAVALEPQVFDLLTYLIENRDRVVTKDDLIEAVWKGRIVSESALTTRINAARRAVGDTGASQRLIRTLPRKGFRFVGEVKAEADGALRGSSAAKAPVMALERPAIAVLPFTNMGGDQEQDYFADGITEDIITALSKWRSFLVIARNSSFIYKGRNVDVTEVGRELGVRYVLEGSVRRAGRRVRITAQLIDAGNGAHIWAERYDRELTDVFDIQDEVTQSVAGAIGPALTAAEYAVVQRKKPEDLDAWDHCLRGLWHFNQFRPEESDKAVACFRRAVAQDGQLADGHAWLARSLFSRIAYGFAGDRAETSAEATVSARRALSLDARNADACYVLALTSAHNGDPEAAIGHARRAVEFNPSFAGAYFALAVACTFSGRPDEALEAVDAALRLSPSDPQKFAWLAQRASALYLEKRYAESAAAARDSLALRWYHTSCRVLAAALAQRDESTAARMAMTELLASAIGEKTIAEVIRPFRREADREHYAAGLRLAGMPAQ